MADIASISIKADSTEIKTATKSLSDLEKQGGKTQQQIDKFEKRMARMEKTLNSAGEKAVMFGKVTAAAFVAINVASIKVFATLEKGFIGVQKTTNFSAREMEKFKGKILELGRSTPVATEGLLNIAGVAGQLGIKGVENVTKFTETMAKLTLATDIVGEEGAAQVARLLNVTGDGIEVVDQFGAVLVALGNNSAATESEILSLGTEIAQATSTFAVSSSEVIAMGAAMKSLGVRAELGGSVVGRAMRSIEEAINAGGEQFEYLTKVTGISGDKLEEEFKTNATGVFKSWLEGIGGMIDSGTTAADALAQFGLKGEEVLKVLPTMAVNSGVLSDALKIANDELEKGTALNNEAAKAGESLGAQWQIVKNIASELLFTIGDSLAPVLKGAIGDFGEWYAANEKLIKQDIKRWAEDIVPVFSSLLSVVGNLAQSFAGWSAVAQDRLGFFEFATMSAKDLSEWLEKDRLGLVDIENQIKKLEEEKQNTRYSIYDGGRGSKALKDSIDSQIESLKKQYETILEGTKNVNKGLDTFEKKTLGVAGEIAEIWKGSTDLQVDSSERALVKFRDIAKERLDLEKRLTDDINELTMSRTEYALFRMEEEYAEMLKIAGEDKKLQELAAKWHKEKNDKILGYDKDLFSKLRREQGNHLDDWKNMEKGKTNATEEGVSKRWELEDKFFNVIQNFTSGMVNAWVQGEDMKVQASQLAKQAIMGFVSEMAAQGIKAVIEGVVSMVTAIHNKGFAGAMAEDGADWKERLKNGAGYLAQAALGIAAIKALGNDVKNNANGGAIGEFATGGWLASNRSGGTINQGSGVKDDVFLGVTANKNGAPVYNFGMGGEFVINKRSTEKYRALIEKINKDDFANGGEIRNFATGGDLDEKAMKLATGLNAGGFGAFVKGWLDDGTPAGWKEGLKNALLFYGTYGAGAVLMKNMPSSSFYNQGGEIRTFGWGDWLDPGNIFGGNEGEGFNLPGIIDPMIDNIGQAIFGDEKWSNITDPGNIFPWITGDGDLDFNGLIDPVGDIGSDLLGSDLWGNIDFSGAIAEMFGNKFDLAKIAQLIWGEDWVDGWFDAGFKKTANQQLKPWVRDAIDPSAKSINWGTNIEESMMEGFVGSIQNLFDAIPGMMTGGILDSFATGTDYVPETGMYMLHKGETVNTSTESEQREKVLIETINNLIATIEDGNRVIISNTDDISYTIKKFDRIGMPPVR